MVAQATTDEGVEAQVAELERRADAHYDRCRACRRGQQCNLWEHYYTRIMEVRAARLEAPDAK